MLTLLWLVPALPLLGFAILFAGAQKLPRTWVAVIGVGSTALSALVAFLAGAEFLDGLPETEAFRQVLWQWMSTGDFRPAVALRLDALSLVMMLVVTFVSFLIHFYSAEFMSGDPGYGRYFAWLNLFVAAMLVLVLADDLLLLYAGWEGVGLCSYLLIGFWYREPANGWAARKAFVVTRIGDTAMIIGLFLLFTQLGSLDIQTVLARAPVAWPEGSVMATAAAALLLGGAVGKSAQLPLQTWLPDAMAGPTPVSALIHAATMVTAGVYLIARTHVLFELAPVVQTAVAVIGAATLLLAAFSALVQHDFKRIIAYSTISQIGYMFLALGVGAWTAAMFHFMTHAFFKALLFLAAGAVMMRVRDEHDIFRMGGLRRALPAAFWTFLIGSASLAALPLVTAGYYSKEMILWGAWNSGAGGRVLWLAGVAGAFLTALYIFRAVFVVFFGEVRTPPSSRYGWRVVVTLAIFSLFALTAGFTEAPFVRLLTPVLPPEPHAGDPGIEPVLTAAASLAAIMGVILAWSVYVRHREAWSRLLGTAFAQGMRQYWLEGWGFDRLYDRLFVRPFGWLAGRNRNDFIDNFFAGLAASARRAHFVLSRIQDGRLRRYAGWMTAGAVAILAMVTLMAVLT